MTTVWVDTNTMLQVYSHGDLFDAHDSGDRAKYEQRRQEMQGALWMVMALCQRLARSESFHRESERNMLRMAPPGSVRGKYTSVVLYLLGDGGVFDGWEAKAADEAPLALSNKGRDKYMVEQCRDRGLTLITRDREVREELAPAEGVKALTPEQYGAEVFTVERARDMFVERMKLAAASYPDRYPADERERRASAAEVAFEVYEKIWAPPSPVA